MASTRSRRIKAFAVLSQLRLDLNRKMYDIAADLAASGELPRRWTGTAAKVDACAVPG